MLESGMCNTLHVFFFNSGKFMIPLDTYRAIPLLITYEGILVVQDGIKKMVYHGVMPSSEISANEASFT